MSKEKLSVPRLDLKALHEALKKPVRKPITAYAAIVLVALAVLISSLSFYHMGASDREAEIEREAKDAAKLSERQSYVQQGWGASRDASLSYILVYIAQHIRLILIGLWVVLMLHGFKVVGR